MRSIYCFSGIASWHGFVSEENGSGNGIRGFGFGEVSHTGEEKTKYHPLYHRPHGVHLENWLSVDVQAHRGNYQWSDGKLAPIYALSAHAPFESGFCPPTLSQQSAMRFDVRAFRGTIKDCGGKLSMSPEKFGVIRRKTWFLLERSQAVIARQSNVYEPRAYSPGIFGCPPCE